VSTAGNALRKFYKPSEEASNLIYDLRLRSAIIPLALRLPVGIAFASNSAFKLLAANKLCGQAIDFHWFPRFTYFMVRMRYSFDNYFLGLALDLLMTTETQRSPLNGGKDGQSAASTRP
jgi:hypothetical protein